MFSNGEKTWISNGGIADVYTSLPAPARRRAPKGLSAFVVPAGPQGLEIVERLDSDRAASAGAAALHRLPGPEIGDDRQSGRGFKIAMSVLDVFRSTVAAAALGFARRALDEALEPGHNERQQGAPLADLQMVQGHIADMALDVDAAALLVYRAAWAKDRVRRASPARRRWPSFSHRHAQEVIDKAVQLHGGDGVRKGQAVESSTAKSGRSDL
jgi:acyl-CoA dehydrogenase